MADDGTVTIRANFSTREAADLAVEHLVQQQGVSRPDIFIKSATAEKIRRARWHPEETPRTKVARAPMELSMVTSKFPSTSPQIRSRLFSASSAMSERCGFPRAEPVGHIAIQRPPKNTLSSLATASESSLCGKWPTFCRRIRSKLPVNFLCTSCETSGGLTPSSSPWK